MTFGAVGGQISTYEHSRWCDSWSVMRKSGKSRLLLCFQTRTTGCRPFITHGVSSGNEKRNKDKKLSRKSRQWICYKIPPEHSLSSFADPFAFCISMVKITYFKACRRNNDARPTRVTEWRNKLLNPTTTLTTI
jgi:hypothetical protein